jgi:hypothetical protein
MCARHDTWSTQVNLSHCKYEIGSDLSNCPIGSTRLGLTFLDDLIYRYHVVHVIKPRTFHESNRIHSTKFNQMYELLGFVTWRLALFYYTVQCATFDTLEFTVKQHSWATFVLPFTLVFVLYSLFAMVDENCTSRFKHETQYRECERCTKHISKSNWSKHSKRCKGISLRKPSKQSSREHYHKNRETILLRRKEQNAANRLKRQEQEAAILLQRQEQEAAILLRQRELELRQKELELKQKEQEAAILLKEKEKEAAILLRQRELEAAKLFDEFLSEYAILCHAH